MRWGRWTSNLPGAEGLGGTLDSSRRGHRGADNEAYSESCLWLPGAGETDEVGREQVSEAPMCGWGGLDPSGTLLPLPPAEDVSRISGKKLAHRVEQPADISDSQLGA